ncbi:MAG: hypothetical protein PUG74_11315, partial [Prevotellaceae bacterium]|nr:hypothetical protein [Prevotellaceae bacterium]
STAMQAVAASSTAMQAVAASSTAMQAVAASSTAMQAVAASSTAMHALYDRKQRLSGGSRSKSGKLIILEISSGNAFDVTKYGFATLSNGSKPNWNNYLSKYSYFSQFKTYCTYIKNDTDPSDWIDYYEIK